MSTGPETFNLYFNAMTSFLAGWLVVLMGLWIFRVPQDRWRLTLLLLPFVKIGVDLARGIPYNSILQTDLNPWLMPPLHGILTVSVGFSDWFPQLKIGFWTRGLDGGEYVTSLADYVYFALIRISPTAPAILLYTLGGISLLKVLRRLGASLVFDIQRRHDRSHAASPLASDRIMGREVDVYESSRWRCAAFTGGVWRPYVCFSREFRSSLTPDEQNSVLRHELAHIRHFDVLFSFLIALMGDFFWFVPGYSYLGRKIERLREMLADRDALTEGAHAPHLASALIKAQEFSAGAARVYSAFSKTPTLLETRINALLNDPHVLPARWLWRNAWTRPLFAFWLAGASLKATLAGNSDQSIQILELSEYWEMLRRLLN